MPTKYNISLMIEPNKGMPNLVYEVTLEIFRRAGLVGKKHVNHFGRIFQGYDFSCSNSKTGVFNIFYRKECNLTIREMLDRFKLTASGFDELAQETIGMTETVCDSLERADPSMKVLPWKFVGDYPLIKSMELETPAGSQSTHVHAEGSGEIIQFFKPRRDNFWYDSDTLKNYLFDAAMESSDLTFRQIDSSNLSWLNRLLLQARAAKRRRELAPLVALYRRFSENPDLVDRLDMLS